MYLAQAEQHYVTLTEGIRGNLVSTDDLASEEVTGDVDDGSLSWDDDAILVGAIDNIDDGNEATTSFEFINCFMDVCIF